MNRPEVQPAVFGVLEAATYLAVGENEVRRLNADGELDGFTTRGGGRLLISRATCDRYIERREAEARSKRPSRMAS